MKTDRAPDEPSASVFAEASEWLVELREGDLDAQGHARFHAWLRRSPEHIRAYLEVAALWGDIPKLAAGMQIDVDTLVEQTRAQSKLAPLKGSVSSHTGTGADGERAAIAAWLPGNPRAWAFAAAAAVVCVVAGLSWLWLQPRTYETAIGEQRSITLADGSTIDLGARSRVRVRLSARERDVELLAGEALFTVSKDPARPFVVASDRTLVRAVGTQFDVHKEASGVTVMVLEGRVALLTEHASPAPQSEPAKGSSSTGSGVIDTAHLARNFYVSAGEEVTVPASQESSPHGNGESHLPSVRPIPAFANVALGQRTLGFEDSPLSDVIEEFNRYNHQQLVLADPALGTLRISGVFAANNPASLLKFLAAEMHLDVANSDRRVLISPPREKNIQSQ